jgi:formate hydrogenlyase transcriptional activator
MRWLPPPHRDRKRSMGADPFPLELLAILLRDRADLQAHVADLEARLRQEVDYLRGEIKGDRNLRTLSGDSAAMKQVRQAIGQVAATDSTVLILGETGTGKELVARAIHQLSPRREHLLVSLNCAALSPTLLASELFGHEAGAFTGASKRRLGRFELAHRGTLFLDEVAELPAEVQVLLLRVLQERTIERVGGNQPIALDVRVIAATHQDLAALVQAGRFRADLFYRLNVFPIHVPALRERPDDIPDLARHFLHHFNRRMNKQVQYIDAESMRLLQAYPWPGNVRELENIVERAMIGTAGDTLAIDPRWLAAPSTASSTASLIPPSGPPGLEDIERQTIAAALARCHGRIYGPAGAAAALQLKPTTLYSKMRKLGIRKHPVDGPPSP